LIDMPHEREDVTMSIRTASCSCGQLVLTTTEDPGRASVCHCLACQRRTGSVFGAQARFRREDVAIAGESRAYVRVGDEGSRVTFHFCASCRSTVHYGIEGREDLIAVPVGAFADPEFPAPGYSVYEDRMHCWVRMPPDVEHLA
jgi:hypothetical protein